MRPGNLTISISGWEATGAASASYGGSRRTAAYSESSFKTLLGAFSLMKITFRSFISTTQGNIE